MTIQNINQPVETLSGGQRQGVAVARAAAFAKRVVIMDEPTAALGVKESRRVLELILDVKKRGLPIILISHNMPHVFEVADRIHIHRLGRRLTRHRPEKAVDVRRGRDDDRRVGAADRTSGVRAERRSRANPPFPSRPGLALPYATSHQGRRHSLTNSTLAFQDAPDRRDGIEPNAVQELLALTLLFAGLSSESG